MSEESKVEAQVEEAQVEVKVEVKVPSYMESHVIIRQEIEDEVRDVACRTCDVADWEWKTEEDITVFKCTINNNEAACQLTTEQFSKIHELYMVALDDKALYPEWCPLYGKIEQKGKV